MDNELNRYYRKIRTILERNLKTIHEELVTAFEPSAPSYTTVTKWANRFHQGREDVNDHLRSASPLFEFADEGIQLVRQVISNNPHSTYDEIIPDIFLSLFHGTIERIVHDCLKMKKATFRWIPHQQTNE